MTDYLLAGFAGLVGGLVGGVLMEWRFWLSFADDVRRHWPGNHRCQKVGCCREP